MKLNNLLKKLYNKNQLVFTIFFIILYCILMSIGDSISIQIGLEKSISLVIGLTLSLILFFFLYKNSLLEEYGLCKPTCKSKSMLYYLPLLVLLSANLWFGVTFNYGLPETIFYILTMFCVGFLEEIIFRGLLFNTMKKDNIKAAIIVSSITFGIGHIINLINGSGADLLSNILQVIYATSAGFMFVMIYYKSQSLLMCILTHQIFNSLSVFGVQTTITQDIISCILLTIITGGYALYLIKSLKNDK